MKFIKDNAFIIGTLLVILLVGTAAFIFARSNNAKGESNIKPVSYTHLTLPTNREV